MNRLRKELRTELPPVKSKARLLFIALIASTCFSLRVLGDDSNQPLIESIRIQGNDSISDKELLSTLPLKVGSPYNSKQEKASREVVLSIYRSQGFMKSAVQTSIAIINPSSASLSISVQEGPLFHFGETTFEGLTTLPDKVIRRSLTFRPGDPYKKKEIFNTQSQLYRTGYFESVNIHISTTEAQVADVQIRVKQQPTRLLKAGVGWGSEERERVSLTLTHKNLFRRAYRAELSGTITHIWEEYRFDFVNPYFFDTKTENRVTSSWREEEQQGYSFERFLAETSFGRALGYNVKATLTPYRIKKTRTFTDDPTIRATTPELTDERAIAISLNRDTANDFFFPNRGTRTNLGLEHVGGFFGGNADYNKLSLESRYYKALYKAIVFAVAGRLGTMAAFSPSEDIPIFDRFFTGGGNSIRGYSERGVGPLDSDRTPLGGRWMTGANAEFRFPVIVRWRIAGAVFIDGGQVGNDFDQVEPKVWRYGAGGGLRLKTPVGPIRLDYGRKINPASNDPDHWRLHFSLGESF